MRRRVNLFINSCTCTFMDQYHIPCRHMIAAISAKRELPSIFSRFKPYYRMSNYEKAFGSRAIMIPLENELSIDESWLPPVHHPKPGRPSFLRVRSFGEKRSDRTSEPYQCSTCGDSGHSQRGCTSTHINEC